MREIVHLQAGQCGNQIGSKVRAPREEVGPRFVTCANDRPTLKIRYCMAEKDDGSSECGQWAAASEGEGRREGSMSHSKRLND